MLLWICKKHLVATVIAYALGVTTTADRIALRERLYKAYASQHAGCGANTATDLIYRRAIRPALLPPSAGPVVDIGCGQGELVKILLADGYDAHGVDISPEQVNLAHVTGVDRVRLGDYRQMLMECRGQFAAVTAMDLLEHLTKGEVLETFDCVVEALLPGGAFIARVPNAASPLGGYIRYGDFTHETSYTARSIGQIAAAVGLCSTTVQPCPPVAHSLKSAVRLVAWKPVSALCKLALAAETGVLRGHIVTQNLYFVARKAS